MPHAVWTGSISFGLVTIPVKLFTAVRADEEIHFHYLHAKDQGRMRNVRRCEVCGKEIPWSDTVRGYEYEKGSYVVVDDEELKAMRPPASQSVEIRAFVGRDEIDPMLFDAPYYLEPEKGGRHAYALLRDALLKAGKVGVAQVVLRTRAHLAVLSPNRAGMVLELLRYPHEIVPMTQFDLPPAKEKASAKELDAAEMLISAMAAPFDPDSFKDEYEDQLRAMLDARARGEAPKRARKAPPRKSAKVIDLVEMLRRSLPTAAANGHPHPRKAASSGHRRAHA
jgi:DNA end-binding protein Ku